MGPPGGPPSMGASSSIPQPPKSVQFFNVASGVPTPAQSITIFFSFEIFIFFIMICYI
jgi:hypothetical protein